MILYLIGNLFLLKIKVVKRLHKLEIWQILKHKTEVGLPNDEIKDVAAREL